MVIPVLVVDANIHDGKNIQKSLEAKGYFQVTLATRAIEALMRFTETKFHVAVIDFGLPDLNGVDLIRQMHGIDESILVVAVLDEHDSQTSELEKLSVGLILDKHTYLSDLPATLSNALNLPSTPPVPDLPPPDPEKHDPQPAPEVIPQAESLPVEEIKIEEVEQEVKEVVDEVDIEVTPEVKEDSVPPWLKDPVVVKDYLSRLGKEHSAYAWLLSQGATPWNFSETITENQALGIVRLLSEHNEGLQSKGALIRYIRLSGTGNDYLLYATPVISDINITLIFSMETPFSVARRQAHKISRLLIEEDPRIGIQQVVPVSVEEIPTTSRDDDEPLQPSEWIPASKTAEKTPEVVVAPDLMPSAEEIPQPDPVQAMPSTESESTVENVMSTEKIPVAEEEPQAPAIPAAEWIPETHPAPPPSVGEVEPELAEAPLMEEMQAEMEREPEVAEEPAMEEMPAEIQGEPEIVESPVMEAVQVGMEREPEVAETPAMEEVQPEVEREPEPVAVPTISSTLDIPPLPTDWLPKNPKPASHLPFLDPLSSAPEKTMEPDVVNVTLQEPKYFLPFTAILLPRFPNHKLVGSLANQLETWLNDLCIAWGWRMGKIDIRPEFLRFTLYLSPDAAPAQSVQSLAQNLSTRILQAFSGLSDDLPSGQFWTKSYLLTAGSDVGKDRLATFIETTRKEQGLTS